MRPNLSILSYSLSTMFIFILISCTKPTEPKEEYSCMKLVYTLDYEIWLYDLMTETKEQLVALQDTTYENDTLTIYYRYHSDEARWSPDGIHIVFIESIGNDESHLKILNTVTGTQSFLPNHLSSQDGSAEWSPNGKKILYSKSIRSFGRNYEIFMMDFDGKNDLQITDRPSYLDTSPSLHSNGVDILFMSSHNQILNPPQIYSTTISQDSVIQMTEGDYTTWTPKFNPQTGEILYGRRPSKDDFISIWKASDLSFSDPIQLTTSEYFDTNWS